MICAAISRPLLRAIVAAGIEVIPEIGGDRDEVLHAYLDGGVDEPCFAMPGTCHRRM